MINLKYGIFLERKIEVDYDQWDIMPIGMHSAINRNIRENAATAHHEYYYNDNNGRTWIVENPTLNEALVAKMTSFSGKKVVGYVSSSRKVETTTQLVEYLNSENNTTAQTNDSGLEL